MGREQSEQIYLVTIEATEIGPFLTMAGLSWLTDAYLEKAAARHFLSYLLDIHNASICIIPLQPIPP